MFGLNLNRLVLSFFLATNLLFNFELFSSESIFTEDQAIQQRFILNPHQQNQKIEYFILKPSGKGPFPVMFMLHGHQIPSQNIGGKQLADLGYLETFAREGILAVAISIPGFGNSEGKRDFSGPDSQKAVAAVIDQFCASALVDPSRIGIYGISKGATLASMVHLYHENIALQILESGWYDLISCRSLMPDYLREKIEANMAVEIGTCEEEFKSRSAIFHPPGNAKTLILHGEYDDRKGLPSAKILHEKLLSEGKSSLLKIYPAALHMLPNDKWDTIVPFAREQFLNIYGIGIKLEATPYIQISKIHAGSPAEKQGKLRVGDTILKISPNNDQVEFEVSGLPVQKFIEQVLGKKGSKLRLNVQHVDLTFEDIEIMRESSF